MFSIGHCLVRVLLIALVLLPGARAHGQTGVVGPEEEERLVPMFYEWLKDPKHSKDVLFLSEVLLITRPPDCQRSSQYWTTLLCFERRTVGSAFQDRVAGMLARERHDEQGLPGVRDPQRQEAIKRVYEEVFGPMDGKDIPQELHPPGRRRPRTADSVRPGPDGLVVTEGHHAMRLVDARLKDARKVEDGLRSLLPTKGVQWRILEHEEVPGEECTRLLSRSTPFVAHRGKTDYLVCGFAREQGATYLMAFDLSKLERWVELRGGTRLSETDFARTERETKTRKPDFDFHQSYRDYESYFSIKNPPGFRLLRLGAFETISALDPEGIDEREVREVIERAVADVMAKQKEKHPDGRP